MSYDKKITVKFESVYDFAEMDYADHVEDYAEAVEYAKESMIEDLTEMVLRDVPSLWDSLMIKVED